MNWATNFLDSPGFVKAKLIVMWQKKRAQFTWLYVLGRASWELQQLPDANT